MSAQVKYNLYPSLLDKFERYVASEDEETEAVRLKELLDTINKVASDEESEAAEKGKAFNAFVDILAKNDNDRCIRSWSCSMNEETKTMSYLVEYVSRSEKVYMFTFDYRMTHEVVQKIKGSISQVFCSGHIDTRYGRVRLYGFIDELYRDNVIDVKTTGNYDFGKFKDGWQRHVYPFCLSQMGCKVNSFEFVVTNFETVNSEWYLYDAEQSEASIRDVCERFINFLEAHRSEITNNRIFYQLD